MKMAGMKAQREQTLAEWVDMLPKSHGARGEYSAMVDALKDIYREMSDQQAIHEHEMEQDGRSRSAMVALCRDLGVPIHADATTGIRDEMNRRNALLRRCLDWWGNDDAGRFVYADVCRNFGIRAISPMAVPVCGALQPEPETCDCCGKPFAFLQGETICFECADAGLGRGAQPKTNSPENPDSSGATMEKIFVRDACRKRMPLDGADAQALEHALTITERERDDKYCDVAQLLTERDAATRRAIEAARIAYMAGHNDTVEGVYGDPDEAAEEICQELADEPAAERKGEQ